MGTKGWLIKKSDFNRECKVWKVMVGISIKLLRRFYLRFLYQKHAFIEAIVYRENQYWRKSKTWIENVIVNVVMDSISIESCLDASICSILIKSMLSWKQSPTEKLTLKWPIWGKSQSCIEIWKYWAGTKGWFIKMCNKGVNIQNWMGKKGWLYKIKWVQRGD